MKIYFAGSITGGRNDSDIYFKIIELLKGYGEVLTEHVGSKKLMKKGENLDSKKIYQRDIEWLKLSDILVAEVSNPSFGVGMEIARATEFGKKILCLCKDKKGYKLSAMISGCPGVEVFEYNRMSDLKKIFRDKL